MKPDAPRLEDVSNKVVLPARNLITACRALKTRSSPRLEARRENLKASLCVMRSDSKKKEEESLYSIPPADINYSHNFNKVRSVVQKQNKKKQRNASRGSSNVTVK